MASSILNFVRTSVAVLSMVILMLCSNYVQNDAWYIPELNLNLDDQGVMFIVCAFASVFGCLSTYILYQEKVLIALKVIAFYCIGFVASFGSIAVTLFWLVGVFITATVQYRINKNNLKVPYVRQSAQFTVDAEE